VGTIYNISVCRSNNDSTASEFLIDDETRQGFISGRLSAMTIGEDDERKDSPEDTPRRRATSAPHSRTKPRDWRKPRGSLVECRLVAGPV
jgi:hypothetical protein